MLEDGILEGEQGLLLLQGLGRVQGTRAGRDWEGQADLGTCPHGPLSLPRTISTSRLFNIFPTQETVRFSLMQKSIKRKKIIHPLSCHPKSTALSISGHFFS